MNPAVIDLASRRAAMVAAETQPLVPLVGDAVQRSGNVVTIDWAAIFRPHLKQAEFLASRRRYRYFMAGRAAGKTWTLGLDALMRALANSGVEGAMFGRSEGEIARRILPEFMKHCRRLREATGIEWIKQIANGNAWIDMINGARIHWRGFDVNGLIRSYDLGWCLLDEVCWGKRPELDVWTEAMPATRIPCALPGLALASSPNGLRGITKIFRDAQMARDPDYYVARCSSYDNTHTDPAMIRGFIATMSKARVDQEIYARVLRPSNVIYPMFREQRHVVKWDVEAHRKTGRWVLGVDWGMSHFAAGLSQVTPEGVWCVVDEIAADVTHYHECRPLILAMLEKWIGPSKAPDIAGADRAVLSENQWLRNYFATSRLEVRTMMTREEQAIAQGISVAASMLDPAIGEPRLLFSDHLSRTTKGSTAPVIAALLAYRWTLNADGEITDIPLKDKVNDHAADWLRYALMATRDRPAFHGGRNLTLALAS